MSADTFSFRLNPVFLATAAALAGALLLAAPAARAQTQPAVVYDAGGKFDKSFNEAAYNGMERFRKETGGSYLEFEIANDTQREQAFRRMAQKGANPIIAIGFTQASALEKVAKEFPQLKFAIVDMVVNLPNVQSVVFKEQEGSFLAGMAAAMALGFATLRAAGATAQRAQGVAGGQAVEQVRVLGDVHGDDLRRSAPCRHAVAPAPGESRS